jgi:hypothetical protein
MSHHDLTAPDYRGIVLRRSSLLVYGADKDYSAPDKKKLLQTLSVWEEDASGARWKAFEAALKDEDPLGRSVLRLPGWCDPDLVAAAWPRHDRSEAMRAWPARKVAVRFNGQQFPFRDRDQHQITDYLIGQGRYEHMEGSSAFLAVADTAKGKSYCTIRAWCHHGDALLGVFAQSVHLQNFLTELLKFTDLIEADILVVDDGRDSLRRAMKKGITQYKVILVLHRTVWNCCEDAIEDGKVTGLNEIIQVIQAAGIGTIVADECHLELKSLIYLEMLTNVNRWIFLSATPRRTDWQEARVLKQSLPLDTALWIKSEPRVCVSQLRFNSGPDEVDLARSLNRRGYFDVPNYFDYLSAQPRYTAWEEMVTNLVGQCFEDGATGVGIVVSGKLEFLDQVIRSMEAAFPERSIGNFSSRIKKHEARMLELESDIIVTTEKSFGGSVNPPRMSHLLLCTGIASEVWVRQISGRLRGLDGNRCVLIDLCDAGFPNTVEQAKLRKRTFKKFAAEFVEGEYTP